MKTIFCYLILLCVTLLNTSCNTQQHTPISNNTVDESEIFFEPEQPAYYLNGGSKGLLNDLYTAMLKTAPVTQDCVKCRAVVKFRVLEDGIIDPNSIEILSNKSVPEDYM